MKKNKIKSIAVLTSGGDAPGMNAAIRAVVRYSIAKNCTVYGIYKGFSGLFSQQIERLTPSSVANIIQRGGTILKTDRCLEFYKKKSREKAAQYLKKRGIDGLIVIGGDGSFTGSYLMEKETGFPVIGVPGTIDNDIYGTDDTIGFDTAVNTAINAIDKIRDTASSHDRLFLVEVMGRNSGFIALNVGIGGGAETIIAPGEKNSISNICKTINRGIQRGKTSSIIVVAEGPKPGLANRIAHELQKRHYNPRVCILGHIQRGGTPTAHDRFLASALGSAAVDYLLTGHSNCMVGIKSNQVTLVPFKKSIQNKKELSKNLFTLARVLAT